jgi:hypothetical protein
VGWYRKHTKVATFTVEELAKAARTDPNKLKGELKRFAQAAQNGDTSYGGQLGSEAIPQYGALVKAALEEGREANGKFFHTATFDIGVEVGSGKGKVTRNYRVDGAPNGAHIIPL